MKLARLQGQPEIFHSIQGEGKNMGRPSIFIRTSLCNLHCIWCDTDYTWNWKGTPFKHNNDNLPGYEKFSKSEYIEEMSVREIAVAVQALNCKNIVLTGGEPLLQQTDLTELMQILREMDPGYFFETETNGTIKPSLLFDQLVDQYNVSPKLNNSNNPKKLRQKDEVYHFFSKNSKAVFKFVISNDTDLEEVMTLVQTYDIDTSKIYLMPEGTNAQDLKTRQQWLVEICKNYGFNYTDRLHIHIYGNKRGV